MEEKGNRYQEIVLRMEDENEFYEYIEKRYEEQGFEIWEPSSYVQETEKGSECQDVPFEGREAQNEQDRCEGFLK